MEEVCFRISLCFSNRQEIRAMAIGNGDERWFDQREIKWIDDLIKWEKGRVRWEWEKKGEWGSSIRAGEWVESESNKAKEREKITIILNTSVTITVHIYTIAVAIVHLCTILHLLMWAFFFFLSKCVKWRVFFFFLHFARFWCGCSYTYLFNLQY